MQIPSVDYKIYVEGKDFSYLKRFLQESTFSQALILCDKNTQKHCLPLLVKKINLLKNTKVYTLPAGEKNKTLPHITKIWKFLLKQEADKNSLLICIGGGLVCDMGGFAASTYKRGIPFINIPTTLLAMADASVGGKNGIDFMGYKNMIGTITQPKGVFILEEFLKTLPERELKNGFAEVVKAALISDAKLWKKITPSHFERNREIHKNNYFIYESVAIKNKIISKDPYEKNLRKTLNFGHTVGHALESYYLNKKNYLLHGEAIAMGMCIELCLGKLVELTNSKAAMEAILWLKQNYNLRSFSQKEITSFITLMQQDKKNKKGAIYFSLLENIGKPLINVYVCVNEIEGGFTLYNNIVHE